MALKRSAAALAALALVLAAARPGLACTTFCLRTDKDVLFGKNYDWGVGAGMLVVNKRGVAKAAFLDDGADSPARWVSTYGSLTFNQYGRELPNGGMNEAGLAIELMWLEETKYPKRDARPAVTELGWIQYQLDNFATVREVLGSDDQLRIAPGVPIHFLVADRTGDCASVEFLDGKMVCHQGAAMPATALANDTYERSAAYVKRFEDFGGAERKARFGTGSLDRFALAATMMKTYDPERSGPPVLYAFDVLRKVAQGEYTQWSIVYDLRNGRVHFRTRKAGQIKHVNMAALDFSCATPAKVLDIDTARGDDASKRFADYTLAANRRLIGASFGGTDFLKNTPAAELDALARYPETTTCGR